MQDRLRCGVIGVGVFGSLHARVYAESRHAELVAVADAVPERAAEVAEPFGAEALSGFEELVSRDDIDIVSVCTPDDLHTAPIVAAARAGKHVLTEKPLATELEGCDAILDAVAEAKVKLMVGHILRFDPRYYQARAAIQAGEIGEVVHFFARRNNKITSADRLGRRSTPLFFLGIHDIDFLRWCAGAKAERVFAEQTSKRLVDLPCEDSTLALIRFANGAIASLETTWILPESFPSMLDARFEAVGTKGTVNVDVFKQGLSIHRETGVEHPHTVYAPELDGKLVGALRDEIEHFMDCVVTDREPLVTGQDGRAAVEIALAIAESAGSGMPVALNS